MVSIIPGIESRAPERTDTSSGFLRSPNFLPGLLLDRGDAGLHLPCSADG